MATVTRAFVEEVRLALRDAQDAALKAFEAAKLTVPLNDQGQIMGELGSVVFSVHAPSPRLRGALKALGEIHRSDRNSWPLKSFTFFDQTTFGQEAACAAARAFLSLRFPGEGGFSCRTWEN